MYSREGVGPRMEPWGTPTLTLIFLWRLPNKT